nr:ATP-binding protein [uncultured Roseateles sp.]
MAELLPRLKHFAETPTGARQVLLSFVALTVTAIALQTGWAIRQDRLLTMETEQTHGLTAVRLLEEHAKQTLRDAEGNLDALVRAIDAEAGGKPADSGLIRGVLAKAQPFNSVLKSLQYVDPKGTAWVNSIDYPAYQTDADDRSYIPYLLSHPAHAEVMLGQPFARFYDSEPVLPMARNIRPNGNRYEGLISTDISISYFSRFYTRVAGDGRALVALYSDAGRVMVRVPDDKAWLGQDVSATETFGKLKTMPSEGSIQASGFLDTGAGPARLYFFKQIQGYPVTAVYARSLDDVLTGWRLRSRDRAGFSAAIVALVLLLSFFLLWHMRRLDRSRASLKTSEAKFANIFHHSPLPLALMRIADDTFVEANDSVLRQFGYNLDEFIGRTPQQLGIWASYAERQPYLELLAAQRHLDQYEVRFRNKAGQTMTCLVSAQLFETDDGDIAIISPIDISKQRETESSVRALELQLREAQKMEAIGTLAGGIAHDFNNILAAILGNVGLAKMEVDRSHAVRSFLDEINRAAVRARSLVQQILAFSRRQPQQLVAQALRPIVDEAMALLRATLPARVALELELSDETMSLQADATQLQQVLMNLCTNGWHALSGSTGHLRVGMARQRLDAYSDPRLAQLPQGDYAHLWVADSGVGMSAEVLARMFEPFFTTKPVGQGTGLGLAVVHGIVKAHQGGITVDSEPGRGTTFHVYLPLLQSEAHAPTTQPGDDLGGLDQGSNERVLYLDDDEVMVLMVERLLRRSGYQVSCFLKAGEALRALQQNPHGFDILVTDFNMPEMSGLDVAQRLHTLAPALPVIISSGFINDELLVGAHESGVKAVMQKQNTLEELPRLIHRTLYPTHAD